MKLDALLAANNVAAEKCASALAKLLRGTAPIRCSTASSATSTSWITAQRGLSMARCGNTCARATTCRFPGNWG